MSRVAGGHFREETRSALDIEGKRGTIQGPSPVPASARPRARPPAAEAFGFVGVGTWLRTVYGC